MRLSAVPLVLACIVLASVLVACSPRPSQPEPSAPPPTIDGEATLRADAAELGFPIRLPQLPTDWQPTSAKRGKISTGRLVTSPTRRYESANVSTIEYLVPGDKRMSLHQSNADERYLVEYLDTADSFEFALRKSDEQDVAGIQWVIYKGEGHKEPVWTTRLNGPTGPAQIAITGTAGAADYRILAMAIQSQPPLAA